MAFLVRAFLSTVGVKPVTSVAQVSGASPLERAFRSYKTANAEGWSYYERPMVPRTMFMDWMTERGGIHRMAQKLKADERELRGAVGAFQQAVKKQDVPVLRTVWPELEDKEISELLGGIHIEAVSTAAAAPTPAETPRSVRNFWGLFPGQKGGGHPTPPAAEPRGSAGGAQAPLVAPDRTAEPPAVSFREPAPFPPADARPSVPPVIVTPSAPPQVPPVAATVEKGPEAPVTTLARRQTRRSHPVPPEFYQERPLATKALPEGQRRTAREAAEAQNISPDIDACVRLEGCLDAQGNPVYAAPQPKYVRDQGGKVDALPEQCPIEGEYRLAKRSEP